MDRRVNMPTGESTFTLTASWVSKTDNTDIYQRCIQKQIHNQYVGGHYRQNTDAHVYL